MISRPRFRIACCLCGKPIPLQRDVYALDAEWQRRFPRMVGTLACGACVVNGTYWRCRTRSGAYVAGHLPAAGLSERQDFDSWGHIEGHGTHVALVRLYPWSGLLQGAGEYLRYTVSRSGGDQDAARPIREALDRWDAQHARPARAGTR